VFLAACASDRATAPTPALLGAETGYWQLTVNHQAVTLSTVAPYDTVRLIPTPRNATGTPLPGAVADSAVTTYALVDPTDTSLTISADGLVRARYPERDVRVVVATRVLGITHADTIPFTITTLSPPPRVASLHLQLSHDTLRDELLDNQNLVARATVEVLDAQGQPTPDVAVRYFTRDSLLLLLTDKGRGTATVGLASSGERPGRTLLYAEATVYGTTVRDSTPVTLAVPSGVAMTATFLTPKGRTAPVGGFEPSMVTLQLARNGFDEVGAGVRFTNYMPYPIDVVFDSPPGPVQGSQFEQLYCGTLDGGNIAPYVADQTSLCLLDALGFKLRWFTVPGTYRYHSELYGTSGTIVVIP
jgi:hypothetical protein